MDKCKGQLNLNIEVDLDTKKFTSDSVFTIINKYKRQSDESSYKTVISYLNCKPLPTKVYSNWVGQLRDCVPLLDRSTENIIIDTLLIPWQYESEHVNTLIHNFVVSLVSGQNYFVYPILECLFQKLVPDVSENNTEDLRVNPFQLSNVEHEANFKVIRLIYSIVLHVPLCHDALLKTIRKSYPYIKKHVYLHVIFVYNMFFLIKLVPNMRRQIFEILLTNIIKLDLHSPRIELEEESDAESQAESEDVFNMEVDGREEENSTTVTPPITSHPIGHSLDILLTLFFRYIHFISHGGSSLQQCLDNSSSFVVGGCRAGSATIILATSTDESNNSLKYTVGCECKGSKQDLEALKSLYLDIKYIFGKIILPTHASSHAQFIVFYLLSLRPSLLSDFLDFLKSIFESPSLSTTDDRKSATAYLGSILSRGKFVKFSHVHCCLELLNKWCKTYLASEFVQSHKYEDVYLHHRFYYACQTLFYIFTFNYKEYTESKARLKLAQSLHLDELVVSPLNPLRYCSQVIALNFAAITRHFQLAYCYGILESNARSFIPFTSENPTLESNGLEMFFPFDPYLLKRSYMFIQEHYMEFEGLPDSIDSECLSSNQKNTTQDGSVSNSTHPDFDDGLLWNSPQSYEISPGYQSFHK